MKKRIWLFLWLGCWVATQGIAQNYMSQHKQLLAKKDYKKLLISLQFDEHSRPVMAQRAFRFSKRYVYFKTRALLGIYKEKYLGVSSSSPEKCDLLRRLLTAHAALRKCVSKIRSKEERRRFIQQNRWVDKRCHQVAKREQSQMLHYSEYATAIYISQHLQRFWGDSSDLTQFLVKNQHRPSRNLSRVDAYARSVRTSTTSTKYLAERLTAPFKDDLLKVRAIYTWISTYINYDYDVLNGKRQYARDSKEVLRRKQGVCGNFAKLFEEVCQHAGLEAKYIRGSAKAAGYTQWAFKNGLMRASNHAWNAVKIDGRWHLIEVTWASCLRNSLYPDAHEFFFLTPPNVLIHSHLPDDQTYQFRNKPINMHQFESLPDYSFCVNGPMQKARAPSWLYEDDWDKAELAKYKAQVAKMETEDASAKVN